MIHIIQWLCPERHCVLAAAYDDAETKKEEALQTFESMVLVATDGGGINPWCGICHSRDLHFEDGVTPFKTMEEAKPALEQTERDQLASRALIDEVRASQN
jgi:hypothetical protein